jgi:DUF917 family protein
VRLDHSDLPALARGCALLGAGGGGDPGLALIMAQRAVEEHGAIEVVAPAELAPDALVMPCGLLGSPTLAAEAIFGGGEGRVLAQAVGELHGERVSALMPYEIAGANGLLPVMWAAYAGLPLVDADGRGRAFPEIRQQAMHVAGVAAGPIVLTDGRGNTLVLRADDVWAERIVRDAVTGVGGVCAAALYCLPAAVADRATVCGSVSRALALGAAMEGWADPGIRAARCAGIGADTLLEGKLIDFERSAGDSFVHGSATVRADGREGPRELRLELQNEFLLAIEDGVIRAAVPDIISVVASDSGLPVSTEQLRLGAEVAVLVLAAPEVWRSPPGLAVAGPPAFGYDVDPRQLAEAGRRGR